MQSAEAKLGRSSLMAALWRYIAAVRDMEQTVLLPSLLREVAVDDDDDDCVDEGQEGSGGKDMYESYLMLKALRNTAESSFASHDEPKGLGPHHQALSHTLEPLLQSDPEVLFRFHLQGIFAVMNSLASKSQSVTSKYLEIVGVAN
ncbi:mid1-interacting protein 1-B-like [Conger conger]|uniref:mid1-interacting protein 1-B-like n=1 Tax=Conger conger TaxID=82655 RepID=UPI002A5B081B|nr:mid1-interacting protein 1-B-like [Conger conger]